MSPAARSGGQLLADQLALHDVELAFCVPGESYLALLDGLYAHRDRLRVITCRHEAAAANAADAYGKLTGRPGVCMVTRGPGATHAEEPSAFVRCMVLPRALQGSPSIRYVRDEDRDRPKSQRYTVFLDEPVQL